MGTDRNWMNTFRPDIPSTARLYDYFLGGKGNFPADRELAERVLADVPEVRLYARANRAFLQRAVRYLVAEAGIRGRDQQILAELGPRRRRAAPERTLNLLPDLESRRCAAALGGWLGNRHIGTHPVEGVQDGALCISHASGGGGHGDHQPDTQRETERNEDGLPPPPPKLTQQVDEEQPPLPSAVGRWRARQLLSCVTDYRAKCHV